ADGVHLGQGDLPVAEARRQAGPGMLIGLSTHTPAEVASAAAGGADYIGVGPVHATPTKPGRPAVGTGLVSYAAGTVPGLPFFAIGGIEAATLPAVLAAGATRVCVLRALTEAADAGRAAAELRAFLERHLAGARA
ncbi:MAG: thiamine phosphate synthase, partial [Actinomycetota bacterium]